MNQTKFLKQRLQLLCHARASCFIYLPNFNEIIDNQSKYVIASSNQNEIETVATFVNFGKT
jgi:hypothetical protein